MPPEVFANVAESTLSVAALSTDATGTLVAGAPFPATGQYRLRLDDSLQQPNGIATRYELCRATFNAGNVVNLFRTGADLEGTTAQAWPIGTKVVAIVTAAALANLARDLGYTPITGNTGPTTGTTVLDVTGGAVTVTVGAGRLIRISAFVFSVSGTVSNDQAELAIQEGGVRLGAAQGNRGASMVTPSLSPSIILAPSAGAHTYKLTIARTGGTGTFTFLAGATNPAYILVEYIDA